MSNMKIDPSKLLGFRLSAQDDQSAAAEDGTQLSLKAGDKIGEAKTGAKVGEVKIGAKIGVSKTGA